jgi:hypothetical protein
MSWRVSDSTRWDADENSAVTPRANGMFIAA